MLYATKFNIVADFEGYFINSYELNKNKVFILRDSVLVTEHTKNQLSFLDKIAFELTSQKDLLLSCEKICEITMRILEVIVSFKEYFDMQFISFLLLKRIFFNFPKFHLFIEDSLVKVLVNLLHFKDKV